MSFKESIVQLGLGPAFHMEDAFKHPEFIPLWQELESLSPLELNDSNEPIWWNNESLMTPNKRRVEILSEILLGANNNGEFRSIDSSTFLARSSMDFPTCIYFRDIIEVYKQVVTDPREVKVVLTTRSTGNKWAGSVRDSILNWIPSIRQFGMTLTIYTFPLFWNADELAGSTFNRLFPVNLQDYNDKKMEQLLSQYHDNWNSYVRTTMQSYANENNLDLDEVFLEFQVQEGWEPLCNFLGAVGNKDKDDNSNNNQLRCPEAGAPYPHVNDKKKYKSFLKCINIFGYLWTLILFYIPLKCTMLIAARCRSSVGDTAQTKKLKET